MKYLSLLILLASSMGYCFISCCNSANATVESKIKLDSTERISIGNTGYNSIAYKHVYIDGIDFIVFNGFGDVPFVVNATKDKLEIELLKKQLREK